MYKDVLFHGRTLDDTIKAFADIVIRKSQLRGENWSAEGEQEVKNSIKENICNKVMLIVRYPKESKSYYKKGTLFRSSHIIRITRGSGFYSGIGAVEVPLSFGDYEIDTLNLTVARC